MSAGIPSQVAALRKELTEARAELAELRDEVGEAQGEILHRLDLLGRCGAVLLRLIRHLHSDMATRKVRRRGAH